MNFRLKYKGKMVAFVWLVVPFGGSAAPFGIQSLTGLIVDYFRLKFRKYAFVYLDDFFGEVNSPSLLEIASKAGLVFHPDKFESGSNMVMLGVQLNLADNTAKVCRSNLDKVKSSAKRFIDRGFLLGKELEKFMGRVAFSAQLCKEGRLNTFFLTGKLAEIQRTSREINDSEQISLTSDIVRELDFWQHFDAAEPLDFKRRPQLNSNVKCYSDASGELWAVKLGTKSFSGKFPGNLQEKSIMCKEAYALLQAVTLLGVEGHEITLYNDNQPLVYAFQHQYSRNPDVHDILKQIYDQILIKDNSVTVEWICTSLMESEGADKASRGRYMRDQTALSDLGAGKVSELLSQEGVDMNSIYDLFSSPADNVFNCKYFSLDSVEEDAQNMEEDAWSLLDRLEKANKKLKSTFWAFPPRQMAEKAASKLAEVGIGLGGQVYLLVDADLAAKVMMLVKGRLEIEVLNFSKPRNRSLFRNRPLRARTLYKLSHRVDA